ncbi:MAG: hypothetical protein JNL58_14405 [Planctomyces sp.]|nr:hypothetical protein [Planctomyces sp.]
MKLPEAWETRTDTLRNTAATQYFYRHQSVVYRCLMPMMLLIVRPTVSQIWDGKFFLLSVLVSGCVIAICYELISPRLKLKIDLIRFPTLRLRVSPQKDEVSYQFCILPPKWRYFYIIAFAAVWIGVFSIPHVTFAINGFVRWWDVPVGLPVGLLLLLSPVFGSLWQGAILIDGGTIDVVFPRARLSIRRDMPVYFHDAGFGTLILNAGRHRIRIGGTAEIHTSADNKPGKPDLLWTLLLPICDRVRTE